MALPKTFSSGERLFASDLNDNFEDLDTRLGTIDLEDLANVGGTPTDGQILEYDTGTSSWGPASIALPAGIGSNVVSAAKFNAFTTNSTSYTDVTGMSVTITPTSASSKILIVLDYTIGADGGQNVETSLYRGGTGLGRFSFSDLYQNTRIQEGKGAAYLDSPATTSAVTYKLRIKTSSGNAMVNRPGGGYTTPGVSTITAIEVAA